jgi:ankyrin repeat protein
MLACVRNYVKIVQMLLGAGANVTLKDIDNNTALTRNGDFNVPIVKMLLEAGADINHQNRYGSTLLWSYLCYMSSTDDKIRFLLEAGANTNLKNISEYNAKRVANILETCKHI